MCIISALVVAGALLVWDFGWITLAEESKSDAAVLTSGSVVHHATVMQPDLYSTFEHASAVPALTEQVYGGIVSHHFYMEAEIGKLFLSLRDQKPSVVVIVGPNHFSAGYGDMQVSSAPFNTPFGKLEPAVSTINRLIDSRVAIPEETAFEREHAVGALVGFVKKTFPNAQLVPIIVNRNASASRTKQLASELSAVLPKDALVLASVDFSHHLDRFAADFHDSQSVSALLNADMGRIRSLEVDSPQSLEVLLQYLQSRDALHMNYTNTNQAVRSGNLVSDDVTSYVFATFTQGGAPKEGPLHFIHYGMFDESLLGADPRGLSGLGGPENNLLRGSDLKVAGVSVPDCSLPTPDIAQFGIKLFAVGKCAISKISSPSFANGAVAFMNAAEAPLCGNSTNRSLTCVDVEGLAQQQPTLVVQVSTVQKARQALDSGADAVFVTSSSPKIELYRGKPIAHLAKAGENGFSTGIVFNKSGATKLYVFPHEIADNKPVRPNIDTRLAACKKILQSLKHADDCMTEVK